LASFSHSLEHVSSLDIRSLLPVSALLLYGCQQDADGDPFGRIADILQSWKCEISEESSGRPKLFADTDYTAKLFNETSGRLDIRSVAEIYGFSISALARMINVEVKTADKSQSQLQKVKRA